MDAESEVAFSIGCSSVRVEQKTALLQFLSGNDIFVCLPTGYGKSLCYILLPLIFDRLNTQISLTSVILVVSPLVSLTSTAWLFYTCSTSIAFLTATFCDEIRSIKN